MLSVYCVHAYGMEKSHLVLASDCHRVVCRCVFARVLPRSFMGEFDVEIREGRRGTRRLSLTVLPGGKVVVTAPRGAESQVPAFVASHQAWLLKARKKMALAIALPVRSRESYLARREEVRAFVHARLQHFNVHYQLRYERVSIKYTRRMWGSCSKKGNLNFNYALIHLPQHLVDYVIVHELCHLKEHNHSPRFWALVAEMVPDYRVLRRELRRFRH